MLILVAVTVNLANENGGLFQKARYAKSETAAKAEEEELTMYMFGEGVYNAKTGEVNLRALKNKLDEDSNKWKDSTLDSDTSPTKLTVIGVQSGEEHIINTDGTMGEKVSIVGTYYGLGELYFSGNPTLKFDSDGQVTQTYYADEEVDSTTGEIYKGDDEVSTGPYTYNETTKTGTLTLTDYSSPGYEHTSEYTFNLINTNNNSIIEVIEYGSDNEELINSVWAKNKCGKLVDLGETTYASDTKTIEFKTSVEDGIDMGRYVIKENGSVWMSMEGYYLCYNGKLVLDDNLFSISDDQSTITYDGEVFTKQ